MSQVDEILRQYSEYANAMFDEERDNFVNFDLAISGWTACCMKH